MEPVLESNQLTGEIPKELGNFSNLGNLWLGSNRLTGEVPKELGNLSNLRRLRLHGNQLTGELPQSFTGLTTLFQFFFDDNAGLCAPSDEAFQTWLQSVSAVRGDNCAPEDSAEDRVALVELYNDTGGANWTDNTNWLSEEPMGEWHGVTTDDEGRVSDLSLDDNQLSGGIPTELGNLSNLRSLYLNYNQLSGEIPTELGNLSNLGTLDLGGNQLSGEMPTELGNLSNLEELWLGTNQLTGEMPTELGNLSNLEQVGINDNQLTGELPDSLTGLTMLQGLFFDTNAGLCAQTDEAFQTWLQSVASVSGDNCVAEDSAEDRAVLVELYNATDGANWTDNTNWLSDEPMREWHGVVTDDEGRVAELSLDDNQLTGGIPTELGNLSSLTRLSLFRNQLTGEIPTELGNLSNLRTLILSGNQLTGEISTELGNLSNLQTLWLVTNQLTGKIPTELANLSNLQTLDLGGNQLTGEIPAELGNLSNLERLFLGGNRIGGGIPAELGNLTNLTELWLGDGLGLTGEIPPELSRLTQLEVIDLGGSEMSGAIPAWLGDLTRLRALYLDGNRFSGELPSELGNLTRLKLLPLHGNAGLLGALPQTLTKITGLDWLTFYDTGLCAPLNESFQTWLRSILDHEGPNCLPEPPAGTTERVIFRDVFGREVNETGLVLVDWEGHIANPAMKYFVELPGATATMSSSEPRLYFDLPSSAGPNGPTRALVSEDPTQAAEFHISIFPDRDTSDESHTLTIRYVVGGGRVNSQTIDVHVIDQDVDRPVEFDVIPDFRHDETGMFDDPAAREDFQLAANDFAYFIADMSLDEVPPGEEPIWIYRGGLDDGVTVTNDISYTGFLMYVYGLLNDDRTAGSDPSCGGSNQSSNGVEIPVRRSGSIFFDPRGVYDNFGWTTSIDEDTWWNGHGQGPAPNDLYSVALHEAGHVLVVEHC